MTKVRLSLIPLLLTLATPTLAVELTNRSTVRPCDASDLLCAMDRLHINYIATQRHDSLVIRLTNDRLRSVVCDLATVGTAVEFLNADLTRTKCE